MKTLTAFIDRVVREEEGQDMVEYALLVGLISLVCVAALQAVGVSLNNLWGAISAQLDAAVAAA